MDSALNNLQRLICHNPPPKKKQINKRKSEEQKLCFKMLYCMNIDELFVLKCTLNFRLIKNTINFV